MIKHLCYSDSRMTDAAGKCLQSALKHGCDSSNHFMPCNIDPDFKEANKAVLEKDRGAGYWLWKPYFINRLMETSDPGDVIVYTDAGVEFVNDVQHLLNEMVGDIMVFGNGWRHGDWCKMDVLKAMDALPFVDEDQIQASCMIFVVSDYSLMIVAEWLEWCQHEGFIDDTPSYYTNEPTFREHRHDQAIFTNLALREGIPYNRWPAQYALRGNEKYRNKYPQIFNHHGLRNDGSRT